VLPVPHPVTRVGDSLRLVKVRPGSLSVVVLPAAIVRVAIRVGHDSVSVTLATGVLARVVQDLQVIVEDIFFELVGADACSDCLVQICLFFDLQYAGLLVPEESSREPGCWLFVGSTDARCIDAATPV
jgi:hypothetical protein